MDAKVNEQLDATGHVKPDVKRALLKSFRSDDLGNRTCFECGDAHPTWLSTSHGILVCLSCSGLHRGLGTHITLVRSVELDELFPEELLSIDVGGNSRAALALPLTRQSDGLTHNYNGPKAAAHRAALARELVSVLASRRIIPCGRHAEELRAAAALVAGANPTLVEEERARKAGAALHRLLVTLTETSRQALSLPDVQFRCPKPIADLLRRMLLLSELIQNHVLETSQERTRLIEQLKLLANMPVPKQALLIMLNQLRAVVERAISLRVFRCPETIVDQLIVYVNSLLAVLKEFSDARLTAVMNGNSFASDDVNPNAAACHTLGGVLSGGSNSSFQRFPRSEEVVELKRAVQDAVGAKFSRGVSNDSCSTGDGLSDGTNEDLADVDTPKSETRSKSQQFAIPVSNVKIVLADLGSTFPKTRRGTLQWVSENRAGRRDDANNFDPDAPMSIPKPEVRHMGPKPSAPVQLTHKSTWLFDKPDETPTAMPWRASFSDAAVTLS